MRGHNRKRADIVSNYLSRGFFRLRTKVRTEIINDTEFWCMSDVLYEGLDFVYNIKEYERVKTEKILWEFRWAGEASAHSSGAQAVPYGVVDTERSEVQLLIPPPCSLMDFLPPLYNQLSNEQGIGVENLFTHGLVYGDFNYSSLFSRWWCDTPHIIILLSEGKKSLYQTYWSQPNKVL